MARGGKKQKLRRQARAERRSRGPGQKQLKKDPGIPNVAPFKANVQREAEKRRRRIEEQVKRQKEDRERGVMERRSLESLQHDAQRRQQQFEQKESKLEEIRTTLNLESETSRKTYYREFRKVVELSDVVLEVLDCRDPLGCRSPQVEQAVLSSGVSKRIVLVLNKIDLVAKDIVQKWLKYLRNELPTVAFKASTQLQKRNLHRSQVPVERAGSELLQSSVCVGADNLMRLLGSYCRNRGLKTAITVGVVGFPNVGKSSVINSLKRSRACNVGATPGVTKCLQEIHLDKHVKLLDCPGIVMASSGTDTAAVLRNCAKIEQLDDPVEPVAAILRRCDKEQVKLHYGIGEFGDARQFLALLARRMGGLKKGGVPDHQRAARAVLTDWASGRICYFTHPPETHTLPAHISAEIVPELGKAFDIEQLEEGNLRCLSEMESPVMDSSPLPDTEMEDGNASGQKPPTHGSQWQEVPMTVLLEQRGRRTPQEPERVGGSVPAELKAVSEVEPLLQGQALKAASRRRRRLQKRADRLATKLSVSLTSAMDFSLRD